MSNELKPKEQENERIETIESADNNSVESFIKKYKMQLIIALGAIIVIAVVAVVWFGSFSSSEDQASLQFSRVLPYYENNDWEKALKGDKNKKVRGESVLGLEYIVQEYKSTEAGKLAALYAGRCLVELDKAKEAEKYFEIATGSNSNTVKQGAYSALAMLKELNNNPAEAAKLYEQAAGFAIEKEVKARLLLYSAINYTKAKEKEKAVKNYQEAIGLSEYSEYGDMAKIGLTELGIIID